MGVAKLISFPQGSRKHSASDLEPEEMIADYLDHLCAPLVPIVPYIERTRLRDEAWFSIEQRMKAYIADGFEPKVATQMAIEKYGRTEKLIADFLDEWAHYQPKGWLARKIGVPHAYATFFFGQAALWAFLLLELRIFFPSKAGAFAFGIPYGELRQIIPQPIPLPDTGWLSVLFLGFVALAPLIAGSLTGRFAVLHAARASYHVLVLLTLASFALGVAMLPAYECLFLAVALMFWWLPVGCLSAHVAAALTWRRRCAYSFPFGGTHDKHIRLL